MQDLIIQHNLLGAYLPFGGLQLVQIEGRHSHVHGSHLTGNCHMIVNGYGKYASELTTPNQTIEFWRKDSSRYPQMNRPPVLPKVGDRNTTTSIDYSTEYSRVHTRVSRGYSTTNIYLPADTFHRHGYDILAHPMSDLMVILVNPCQDSGLRPYMFVGHGLTYARDFGEALVNMVPNFVSHSSYGTPLGIIYREANASYIWNTSCDKEVRSDSPYAVPPVTYSGSNMEALDKWVRGKVASIPPVGLIVDLIDGRYHLQDNGTYIDSIHSNDLRAIET